MNHLLDYAKSFLHVPYRWGGDNPVTGLDCSGLVQMILASVGMDPTGDQTAQGLYDVFEKTGSLGVYGPGSLVFFGESVLKITHIAFCLDSYLMIEAGGGDHTVKSISDAVTKNAFVRMRLIKSRRDLVAVVKPRYSTIGLV
jgi:cell wall-associated NlpC family hydrolase